MLSRDFESSGVITKVVRGHRQGHFLVVPWVIRGHQVDSWVIKEDLLGHQLGSSVILVNTLVIPVVSRK